tara:strand:- start:1632 stop:2444 length:813 start_codon:yes stop_codon:yes gene_type:complete
MVDNPFKSLFDQFRDSSDLLSETLNQASVRIIKDERFILRVMTLSQRRSWVIRGYIPETDEYGLETGQVAKVIDVDQQMYITDDLVREVAVPYLRSADYPGMAKVLVAWERIVGRWEGYRARKTHNPLTDLPMQLLDGFKELPEMTQDECLAWVMNYREKLSLINRRTVERYRHNELIDAFTRQEIIPRGMMIVDFSFRTIDVSPQSSTTIQGLPPMPDPYSMTPSSHIPNIKAPEDKAKDKTLSSEITNQPQENKNPNLPPGAYNTGKQ